MVGLFGLDRPLTSPTKLRTLNTTTTNCSAQNAIIRQIPLLFGRYKICEYHVTLSTSSSHEQERSYEPSTSRKNILGYEPSRARAAKIIGGYEPSRARAGGRLVRAGLNVLRLGSFGSAATSGLRELSVLIL